MPKPKTVAGTAADPTVRFAKLEMEGETYSLAYDFNAIATAEKLTGVNLLGGLTRWLQDLDAREYRGIFYAALLKAHPAMTVEEAGALIRLDTMPAINDAIVAAYRLSIPQKKDAPEQLAETS
jgi:hypothetical protein